MANPCNYILNVNGKEIKIPVGDDVALAKALHDADLKSLHDSGVIKLTNLQIKKLDSIKEEGDTNVNVDKELAENKEVIAKAAEKLSIKPTNFEDMYRVHREVFGLNKEKALAATFVTDKIISTIARRADITKDEAYAKLEYRKGDSDFLERLTPDQKVSAQDAKAAVVLAKDGSAIIHALTDLNVSSSLHEIAHVYEKYLTDKERGTILKNAGHTEWGDNTSEHFARGFEKYLAEGVAPDKNMNKVFDNFKTWMTDIYKGIKGSEIDIKLNKPMRDLYDTMLGESPKLKRDIEAELSKMKEKADNLKDRIGSVRAGVENITQIVKESLKNKELTKGQFNSIMNNISKITSARDINKAIDNAVDFIDRVINKSDWDNKNKELKANRLKAIKNLSDAKIDKSNSAIQSLKKMLSIDPDLIPESSLPDYNEVVSKMANISGLTETGKLDLVRKADIPCTLR